MCKNNGDTVTSFFKEPTIEGLQYWKCAYPLTGAVPLAFCFMIEVVRVSMQEYLLSRACRTGAWARLVSRPLRTAPLRQQARPALQAAAAAPGTAAAAAAWRREGARMRGAPGRAPRLARPGSGP